MPVAPNVGIAIAQEPGPFARSVTPCDLTVPAVDGCGYAVYRVTVTNKSGVLVPGPFYVDFTGTGTVTDTPVQLSDIPACAGSCAQTGTPARSKSPISQPRSRPRSSSSSPLDRLAATSTVKAQIVFPDFPPPAPSDSTSPTLVAFDDLPPDTLLPISTNYGGTVRKSKIDPGTGGNFKSAFKIPSDNANKYKGLKTSVDESVGMESCSPSFKICLDTALKIVTGAGVVYHQDGTLDDTVNSSILTITLIRDFKTLASSGNALHSQIYYPPMDWRREGQRA